MVGMVGQPRDQLHNNGVIHALLITNNGGNRMTPAPYITEIPMTLEPYPRIAKQVVLMTQYV